MKNHFISLPIRTLFIFMLLRCHSPVYSETLHSALSNAYNKGKFILPDAKQLQQTQHAFQLEFGENSVDDLWDQLAIQRHSVGNLIFLQEALNRQTGRGFYAIRKGDLVKPWLIQAPHAKSDKYTGKIAELLFSENKIKAAMWNSVHRKTAIENSPEKKAADMAHLADTYWQVVTEIFGQHYQDGKIIQLHGFAQSKRKSLAGKQSDMIISAGHQIPPKWVKTLASCLKKTMPGIISLYPYDVKELGGTTNSQNKLLKKIGFHGFVHIEMSETMRYNLLQNKNLRLLLLNCIQ